MGAGQATGMLGQRVCVSWQLKVGLAIWLALLASASATNATIRHPTTRAQFAARLRMMAEHLRRSDPEGSGPYQAPLTETDVRTVLGPPSSVLEADDAGVGLSVSAYRELRYGQRTPDGFPTLGRVGVDDDGSLRWVVGAFGMPIAPRLLKEAQLHPLLELIDRAAQEDTLGGRAWNPLNVIQAVNALHPLGKKKAFAVLQEYKRLTTPQSGWAAYPASGTLHILFRLLMPISVYTDDSETAHQAKFIEAVEDVPLNLFPPVGFFSGSTGFAEIHLREYEQLGVWRQEPLRPPTDPLGILARLQARKPELQGPKGAHFRQKVMQQLLRLAATAYVPAPNLRLDGHIPEAEIDLRITANVQAFQGLAIRWDARKSSYVRGTPLTGTR
jgi:hypothetical protein